MTTIAVSTVGLTGGIATGKSTVALLVREAGIPVIDADVVARDLLSPGAPLLQVLAEAFGRDILTDDGALDRARLRQRISHDPEARERLNALTHPAIRAEMAQRITREARAQHEASPSRVPVVFVEAALLVETGSYTQYAHLWVVSCSADIQLRRVIARDGSTEEDARALIAAQMPQAAKEAVATRVIRNDGGLEALRSEVLSALEADGLLPVSR